MLLRETLEFSGPGNHLESHYALATRWGKTLTPFTQIFLWLRRRKRASTRARCSLPVFCVHQWSELCAFCEPDPISNPFGYTFLWAHISCSIVRSWRNAAGSWLALALDTRLFIFHTTELALFLIHIYLYIQTNLHK
jgi:hypothetical protein